MWQKHAFVHLTKTIIVYAGYFRNVSNTHFSSLSLSFVRFSAFVLARFLVGKNSSFHRTIKSDERAMLGYNISSAFDISKNMSEQKQSFFWKNHLLHLKSNSDVRARICIFVRQCLKQKETRRN